MKITTKITTFASLAVLTININAREPVGINDQLVNKETGEPLIVMTSNQSIPMIDLNTIVGNITTNQASKPLSPNLPNIDLGNTATNETQNVPKIKYWHCHHNKCNKIELAIFNSSNAELINLDNQLNEGWNWLVQNYPDQPILNTRLQWVLQRDQYGLQVLQQYGNSILIKWLIDQYKARINQLDQLGLIPKKQVQ